MTRTRLKVVVLISLLTVLNPVEAQEVTATVQTQSTVSSVTEESPWLAWNLTASDWEKYQRILKTPRASFSPNMSPVQALGLSTTGSEQARYAMIQAKLDEEFVHSDLVWQRAVNTARESDEWLFFRSQLYADYGSDIPTTWVDHPTEVYLFVEKECLTTCLALLEKAKTRTHAPTHFFVSNLDTDDSLRQWATRLEIPVELVANGAVTLNHHSGQLVSLGFALENLPVAVGKSNGNYVLLQI